MTLRLAACFLLLAPMMLLPPNAGATTTVCSNPARAGVRAQMSVRLPVGGAAQLEDRVGAFAERQLGMSVGAVAFEDPGERPVLRTRNLILQSPQVSVAIEIRTSNRNNRAMITVERTCINDAWEPWRPYWRDLQNFLRTNGYRINGR